MQTSPKTLRNLGFLYLIVAVLTLTVGSFLQVMSFSWGLIGTELFCILLPALIYARLAGIPLKALRLRWPGWKVALACLLLGAASWPVVGLIDAIAAQGFGYTIYSPPYAFPTTPGQAVVLFVALAVSAAVCEEILFRGVVMRSLAGKGAFYAVVVSSLLFLFIHFRLQGLAALVPLVFLLGYVGWKTGSTVASMIVHFAVNAFAAVVMILSSLRPDLSLGLPSLPSALLGLVLAVVVLLWLKRLPAQEAAQGVEEGESVPATRFGVLQAWPFAIFALIYLVVAALEYVVGTDPSRLSAGVKASPDLPQIQQAETYVYEARNIAGEVVGQMECSYSPDSGTAELSCRQEIQPYRVERGQSLWISDGFTKTFHITMTRTGAPARFAWEMNSSGGSYTAQLESISGGLQLVTAKDGQPVGQVVLEDDIFTSDEMFLRLSSLPFGQGYARSVEMVEPLGARPGEAEMGPVAQSKLLVILGGEPVATPAGKYITWRVEVGDDFIGWYDAESPHRLVKFNQLGIVYSLQ